MVKKRAVSKRYTANPEAKKKLHRQWYTKHYCAVLQKRCRHYYASVKKNLACTLLRHAVSHSRENAKNKLYRNHNKEKILIANHKLFNPKKEEEKESYFYSLLLLFVPFRNEDELTEEGESAEVAFNRHMEHNDALNIHCDKLQTMLRANENVQKINKSRQAEQQH